MQSSSRRSLEIGGGRSADAKVLEGMRRRFIEASRRAEIIALVNAAQDADELARTAAEELCEVFDAEIGFVVDRGEGGTERRVIGSVGVPAPQLAETLPEELCRRADSGEQPTAQYGDDVIGHGTRAVLLAAHAASAGNAVLVGVARTYEQRFNDSEAALLGAVTTSIALALERLWALDERLALIERLKESFLGAAEALANALAAKDNYTATHAREIAEVAVAVGEELGLEGAELESLRYGAIFHDIGKIAVPDAILRKPGPLTDEEWALVEKHAEIGEQIVAPVPFLAGARPIIRHDHERWDGSGYPDGLAGEEIPIGARIVFVADAYHAMISDRPYRAGMTAEEACAELRRNAGSQFDPAVVEAFERVIRASGGDRS